MIQVIEKGRHFIKSGLDSVGPLPSTKSGNQYYVKAIYYGTGWVYATPIKQAESECAIATVK